MAERTRWTHAAVFNAQVLLAGKVAITLETCHTVEVLHEAFTRLGWQRLCIEVCGCYLTA